MYTVPYYDNPGSSVGLAVGSGVLAAKEIDAAL
ncbi:fumarate reductase flavoprotein subunit [Oribacterium sp. WCC10]|nr:fumarate reductase flavoprotein subunit [Oribacterium sp. WCC10]